jgi:hypothetical protein
MVQPVKRHTDRACPLAKCRALAVDEGRIHFHSVHKVQDQGTERIGPANSRDRDSPLQVTFNRRYVELKPVVRYVKPGARTTLVEALLLERRVFFVRACFHRGQPPKSRFLGMQVRRQDSEKKQHADAPTFHIRVCAADEWIPSDTISIAFFFIPL